MTVLSEAEVQAQFGSLLSALPPAPQHFILYFRFESDELTAESRALVPDILRAVKDRPVPGGRRRPAIPIRPGRPPATSSSA